MSRRFIFGKATACNFYRNLLGKRRPWLGGSRNGAVTSLPQLRCDKHVQCALTGAVEHSDYTNYPPFPRSPPALISPRRAFCDFLLFFFDQQKYSYFSPFGLLYFSVWVSCGVLREVAPDETKNGTTPGSPWVTFGETRGGLLPAGAFRR